MASHEQASIPLATQFGGWLRQLREEKSLAQRSVAAAADMDASHYGKVESGKRFLTEAQMAAVARLLDQPEPEVRRRMAAAQLVELCGGDASLARDVAGIVQEQAAPYLSKPAKKQRKANG